jgi:hypothetical protein
VRWSLVAGVAFVPAKAIVFLRVQLQQLRTIPHKRETAARGGAAARRETLITRVPTREWRWRDEERDKKYSAVFMACHI